MADPGAEVLDVVGRRIQVGDFIGCANGFTIRLCRVVEIKDSGDERPAMARHRFTLKVQGYKMSQKRVQRAAWLEHIHGRLMRLEPEQIPAEVAVALGRTRGGRADLEREQQLLLRRLADIDSEMERLPGDDDSHIDQVEVFRG